ncbi:tRNA (adenosine(37)-N6)-dimethylallyltransferase MiaA [Candidatus Kaiserbacteria bacterium]|nr:tRNA (adenosine(37)-N6)-dimethylallyltransferase MiaA [Candidatus Kaiserbacteria bacterium]
MAKKQKVLVIVGPTSSGKSALAVALARRLDGEVISADSRQVYRGLDIGTGKITKREKRGIPHYLLDEVSPRRIFTADDFVRRGCVAIADISSRGKLPIVAGGTGFYIDALVGRILLPNVPPNKKLRAQLEEKPASQLFTLLKKKDPRRAKTIEPQHKRRLIRALEVVSALGKVPMIDLQNQSSFDPLWLGITLQSKVLERKIRMRLRERMRQGMVAEARRLHAGGLSYKRMEELGLEYRSLARLLQGTITRGQMIDELNRAISKYAIRQLRYWKRNKDIRWFMPSKTATIEKAVRVWLK